MMMKTCQAYAYILVRFINLRLLSFLLAFCRSWLSVLVRVFRTPRDPFENCNNFPIRFFFYLMKKDMHTHTHTVLTHMRFVYTKSSLI